MIRYIDIRWHELMKEVCIFDKIYATILTKFMRLSLTKFMHLFPHLCAQGAFLHFKNDK
jgi:hypothetical protein